MLGVGEIIGAILALGILFAILLAMVLAAWKVVHNFRRQHRLEAEADERAHRKQMADDYNESLKLMEGTLGTSMSFQDYTSSKVKELEPEKR